MTKADEIGFCLEIKAVLKAGVPAEPDPVALHDYLTYLYFPYPSTAYKHVRKMAPGSAMEVLVGSGRRACAKVKWKYWDAAETAGAASQISERDMIERARELMEEAVKLRMMSDVPLGLFVLSGGLDSGGSRPCASRNSAGAGEDFHHRLCNSKFYDELPVAKLVARKIPYGPSHPAGR